MSNRILEQIRDLKWNIEQAEYHIRAAKRNIAQDEASPRSWRADLGKLQSQAPTNGNTCDEVADVENGG